MMGTAQEALIGTEHELMIGVASDVMETESDATRETENDDDHHDHGRQIRYEIARWGPEKWICNQPTQTLL